MFAVRWSPSALSDLAEFWSDADTPKRRQITESVHEIDDRLKDNADNEGESRGSGTRVLIVAPLGIEYAVHMDRRIAFVFRVWQFRTPN